MAVNDNNQIIAFCSQVSQSEKQPWLEEINQNLSEKVVLVPFNQLSEVQKRHIELAVVANPNPDELDQLVNLNWVQSLWAGVENLVANLSNKSVKIVKMVDPKLSSNMAEAVLTFTLYLHRNVPKYIQQQGVKQWKAHQLIDANKRRIGILGLGELGRASANKLLENGFKVSGWSKSLKNIKGIECFDGEMGFIQLLQQSDILICLLPLTIHTKNLMNKETLNLLPKGASIINFSRGQIVNEKDLLDSLDSKHLNHAVLDVFNIEPLPEKHPFWMSTQVTVLPHISAPTDVKSASVVVVKNIQNYLNYGKVPKAIDLNKGY